MIVCNVGESMVEVEAAGSERHVYQVKPDRCKHAV